MTSRRSQILGIGSHVPPRVVSNDEVGKLVGVPGSWILERTGIQQRHWVQDGVGSSDLAVPAAQEAIAAAGIGADQIDMIVFATLSPDHVFPGAGVFLQRKLGLPPVAVLDIRQQCTGFIYGLAIADQFVRTGTVEHVLVVGAEVHSTGLDLSPAGRDVTVLFGDGAGAAVVGAAQAPDKGILTTRLYADGTNAEDLWVEVPSSRKIPRLSIEDIQQGRHFPRMRGRQVFRNAVSRIPELVRESLAATGATPDDLGCLILHQANLRISEHVQAALQLPADRIHNNVDQVGNTTAASIPICMADALQKGKIVPGALVCLAAFGAGYTWASCVMRW